MQLLATIRFIINCLFENAAIKLLFLLLMVLWFCVTIGHVHASENINNKPLGVCVFDIDFTLKCDGASSAVTACKDAGFALAVNTSRKKAKAYEVVTNGFLLSKGFDQEFIDLALSLDKNQGPFQYGRSEGNQSPEEIAQSKSYAMRNIAKYYGFKADDIESRKLVLFDDLYSNIMQVQPDWYDRYNKSRCYADLNGDCYFDPRMSPSNVSFPRNWKIYTGLWIGNLCQYWRSSYYAWDDARTMIDYILIN